MKDPKRIKRIIKLIENIWKDNPEWRLTQLMMNALTMSKDPYYVEDGVLEDGLVRLKENLTE